MTTTILGTASGPEPACPKQSALPEALATLVRAEVNQALAARPQGVTIIVFSGDMDRVFAALAIANGAAACGLKATLFFTFWGLSALRCPGHPSRSKPCLERALGWMLPKGTRKLGVSRWNFGGAGAAFFRWRMKSRRVQSLEELMADARELGVRIVACQMSADVLGIPSEEWIPGVETGGVATFIQEAAGSSVTLFV